jgi:two-component system, NarL family, response regulator DevR
MQPDTPERPDDDTANTHKKRVFLVDDHEIVRAGVREMLEATGEFVVVGEAGSVDQALNRLQGLDVDVAVLDVRLPDGNGIELCRDIRSSWPDIACLMLTSFSHDDALVDAAMAGAHGYALKQIRGTEIIDAVRIVASGRSTLDAATTRRALDRMQRGTEEQQQLAQLSEQERRIFEHIGQGLSNRQIAEHMFLAEKTVKNYVSNLLSKLGMSRRTEAAAMAARIDERSRRKLYDM